MSGLSPVDTDRGGLCSPLMAPKTPRQSLSAEGFCIWLRRSTGCEDRYELPSAGTTRTVKQRVALARCEASLWGNY